MTLLHLHHHHHHLDPLYSKTIKFLLHHHHHLFSQPHTLEHLYCMVILRPRHILLWPPHQLLMKLKPVLIGLSRGSGLCMFLMGWDGYDDLPMATLPVQFRMQDIERYTGIGCPRIHLQLCNAVMRGHRLDEAQMIMLFPLSLSGATQRWFASLDPSRSRTWADLGQEFIRQHSFNTVVDVSQRELEALRQRPDESVTSFISR